ncbi:DUF3052 domain-containing protein [Alkalihalobacillus sp. MEB130]|uniref:DUF3052 domain-containing protein n=1 Tax=Alkalihalobacillus sp. MEB130 TaxID=2976704 RepID=UPI0028E02A94|nr:DUF3052 domain-containing protein [Alkalihalobacillus sp. MEB130]MDT8860926.1 DUF3052 domain-containing protein [Alkalihalobacillus sp. MEB130]
MHPVIKKLQWKEPMQSVLVLAAPAEYEEVLSQFEAEVDTEIKRDSYAFIHVFGATNQQLKDLAIKAVELVEEDGMLWLSYPKKSSKKYKGSDCSRDTVGAMLSQEGYEPVRQVAIDEDWSALRFRPVDKIKTMKRTFAVTEKGKERTKQK